MKDIVWGIAAILVVLVVIGFCSLCAGLVTWAVLKPIHHSISLLPCLKLGVLEVIAVLIIRGFIK